MYKWLISIVGSQSSTLAVHLVKRGKASIKNLAVIGLDEQPREILALSAVLHWTQSVQRRKLSNCRFPMSARICNGEKGYM
ncbi:hypothetical protein [Bacillus sp. (in: firmicutes)]|uniref:hypothetical protein n=1 Tax=Bacillus sp. TaxID=1409 RepID=UPI0023F0519B|nr:hypothetical protein [Bacillus sp. (in: firmicutes)]